MELELRMKPGPSPPVSRTLMLPETELVEVITGQKRFYYQISVMVYNSVLQYLLSLGWYPQFDYLGRHPGHNPPGQSPNRLV